MKDERWDLIITIVDKALTLSDQEKETYLSTVCRENPAISDEIEALLRSIEEAEEEKFLESLDERYQELLSDMETEDGSKKENTRQSFIGKEFGAYRITEAIGEGGMGTVYKAKRTDGDFHHTVAIKRIRQGLDSKENVRRFKMEREVLAGLHHPNIAQLYDGGINPEGIPYLVMEFVDGIPIDQYCNEHRLTIDERLALFKDACSAIQYAHNNLVIHRDLKNHNVFVSREGVVKILDFGVAKLLADPLDETTLVETQPGQRFWTPQYAAPEQVNGDPITTATDIYTLGVLLYKLLADLYPLDLEEKNLMEIGRAIRDEAAPSPSRKIRQGDLKTCANRRSVSASELVKTLSGDLDALTLKALRKEPKYRYHSVGQLLDDLDNYHKKLPLAARNDTIRYRIGKFFRRHKMGLSAAAVFLILATGFAAFYSYRITAERAEAQQEAAKATEVTEFLLGLFAANEPGTAPTDTITARTLLASGVERADFLDDQPAVQAEMLLTLGRAYYSTGDVARSENLLRRALDVSRRTYAPDAPNIANNLRHLGYLLFKKGAYNEAEQRLRRAIEIYQSHPGDEIHTVIKGKNLLALVLARQGHLEESEAMHRDILRIRRELLGDSHVDVAVSLNNLAYVLVEQGKIDAAEPLYRQALETGRDLYGEKHILIAANLQNLGNVLAKRSEFPEAERYLREALAMKRELWGANHFAVAKLLSDLADVLRAQHKFDEAEVLVRDSLSIYRESGKPSGIAWALSIMGHLYADQEMYDEAEPIYSEALSLLSNVHPNDHPEVQRTFRRFADLYNTWGKPEKAAEYLALLEVAGDDS